MKQLLVILFLIIALSTPAQVMKVVTPYDTTANLTIVTANVKSEADMIVMMVSTKRDAGDNVFWKLTNQYKKQKYDYTIRFVTTRVDYDFKVYFTTNENEVGIISEHLKQGLEHFLQSKSE